MFVKPQDLQKIVQIPIESYFIIYATNISTKEEFFYSEFSNKFNLFDRRINFIQE